MRRILLGMIFCCAAMPALTAEEDIVLRGMGSFHVGGRVAEVSGKPVRMIVRQPGGPQTKLDPNGQYMVEQMYVQYFLPQATQGQAAAVDVARRRADRRHLREHARTVAKAGSTCSSARAGTSTSRTRSSAGARASRPPTSGPSEPTFLTYADPFERFRIGDGEGSWNPDPAKRKVLPGSQFPVEAYDNYMKQSVPRWLSTDDAIIAAYVALVDKVCPCVLLLHSQGGAFGFKVAEQRPDKVKAIVAVESATAGNLDKAAALKDTPVLMLFGDYVDQHPRWANFKKIDLAYADAVRAGGGTVDVINLPDLGIKGNSHMLMQDKNNAEIADVIQKWLAGKGLVE